MKLFIASLFLLSLSAYAQVVHEPKLVAEPKGVTATKTSPFCLAFDKAQGFTRCETSEIICYRFGKLEQCYPKPPQTAAAPASKPAPASVPVPTTAVKK